MKAKLAFFVLGLSVVVFSLFQLNQLTNVRRFQEDEHIFVRRGIFADYYLAGNFSDPIWKSFDSFDVPKFGELFYGVALRMYSGKTVAQYFASVPKFVNSTESPDFLWPPIYSHDRCCTIQDLPTEIQQRLTPVLIARKFALIFPFFSLLLLYVLCWRTKNWIFGITATLIFSQNVLFQNSVSTAMSDGMLLFFSLLYAAFSGLLFGYFESLTKKKKFLLFTAAAISAGLATATKLNGVINLIHFGLCAQLYLGWFKHPFRVLKYQLLFVAFAYMTFFVLNPFLWSNPVKNSLMMNISRQVTIEKQQERGQKFNQDLRTISARMSRTYERTLSTHSFYGNFTNQHIAIPIGLILFAIGLIIATQNFTIAHTSNKPRTVESRSFLLWIVLWTAVTTILIPLDWDHYYLPVVLGISCAQAIAFTGIIEWLLARLQTKLHVIPHQE